MDLTANLAVFSPAEFINLIAAKNRTGALYFDVSGENGEIFFEQGVPVHAEYKGMKGVEAIYNIAIEKTGTASYKDEVQVKERTVNAEDTNGLLSNIEKRKLEFDEIMSKLPPFEAVLEKRAEGVQENVALRKTDWAMIRIVDGKRSIKDLIRDSNLPLLEACKTLEWLIEKGLLFDRSFSERLIKAFEKSLNNILDIYSVKGTNSKEWADFIFDTISNEGYETVSGMLSMKNDSIVLDDSAAKVLTEENIGKIKKKMFERAHERAIDELGNMIAKKKHNELLKLEGDK